MLKKVVYIIIFIFYNLGFCQVEKQKDSIDRYVQYYVIEGDTIPKDAIGLDEVIILGKLHFKDKYERRRYLILRRKTRKVYPYAKLAADRLTKLNERLEKIKSKGARRRYIKRVQKYIEGEFTAELKKMTRTEGQILVKLVHRQTGKTMFDLVKQYRSGWSAFWYNSTASLFDISLKRKYNPLEIEEDYWIEDILQRSFQSDILEEQKTALDFKYHQLTYKWADTTTSTGVRFKQK
ncbi:DUF4294 domain-containing protein [Aquimarina rhabdastrellae]